MIGTPSPCLDRSDLLPGCFSPYGVRGPYSPGDSGHIPLAAHEGGEPVRSQSLALGGKLRHSDSLAVPDLAVSEWLALGWVPAGAGRGISRARASGLLLCRNTQLEELG